MGNTIIWSFEVSTRWHLKAKLPLEEETFVHNSDIRDPKKHLPSILLFDVSNQGDKEKC